MPSVLNSASKNSVLFTIPYTYANSAYIVKTSILRKTILKLLKTGHARNVHTLADRTHPADIASALSVLDQASIKQLFDHITDNKTAAKIIAAIKDKSTVSKTVAVIKKERLSEMLNLINPNDCADLIGFLPMREAEALLKLSKKETASVLHSLLKYAPNTSGGIMNTRYISLEKDSTISDAIKELKTKGHSGTHIINLYVKDQKQCFCGVVPVSSIFAYPADTTMARIMDENIIPIEADLHQNKVITIFNRYKLLETAVVDKDKKIIGVITSDDVSAIIEEEIGKDIQEISGSLTLRGPLRSRSLMAFISLMLITVSSYIILKNVNFLDPQIIELLSVFPLLIVYPAILAFQASSSTSRDFDIGLLEPSDLFAIAKVELKVGFVIGLFSSALLGTALFFYFGPAIKDHATIAVCFMANIIAGCMTGGLIPFIFRKKSSSYLPVSAPIVISLSVIVSCAIYLALSLYLLSVDIIPSSWKIF